MLYMCPGSRAYLLTLLLRTVKFTQVLGFQVTALMEKARWETVSHAELMAANWVSRCPTFWHLWATMEEEELSWATR